MKKKRKRYYWRQTGESRKAGDVRLWPHRTNTTNPAGPVQKLNRWQSLLRAFSPAWSHIERIHTIDKG